VTDAPRWRADLDLAHTLADAADRITMARFLSADLTVETKPDLTPVTDADRAVERALRDALERERPDDAVVGEEYGDRDGMGESARRWVIDPIDGTKNFVRGVPVWATLIGLQVERRTVVGVVSAPALGRRWWASSGGGAWTSAPAVDARRCRVSAVGAIENASISYSSLVGWEATGRGEAFIALLGRAWRSRAYGDFWSHMLVAEGAVDASCEPELSLWDLAALQVIVTEAGGRFTDLSGVDHCDGGSVLCTNGRLHDEIMRSIGS